MAGKRRAPVVLFDPGRALIERNPRHLYHRKLFEGGRRLQSAFAARGLLGPAAGA